MGVIQARENRFFSPTSPAIIYESIFVERFLKKSFLIGSNPQAISS